MHSATARRMGAIICFSVAAILAVVAMEPSGLSVKPIAFIVLASMAAGVMTMPIAGSIMALLFYVGIEGAAKLVSRYHPIVHVGFDLLFVALSLRVLLTQLTARSRITEFEPPLWRIFAVHFGWFFVVFLNPYAVSLLASVAAAKLYVIPPLLFFYGFYLCNSIRRVEQFLAVWIFVAFLNTVTSFQQAAIGPASVLSLSPSYGEVLERFRGYPFRPFGLTSNPGVPALFPFLTGPAVVYFSIFTNITLIRVAMLSLLGAFVPLQLLCQVKSALIKFIFGQLVFLPIAFYRFRSSFHFSLKKVSISIVALAVVVTYVIPRINESLISSNQENAKAFDRTLRAFDFTVMSKARTGAFQRFMLYAESAPFGAGLSRIGPAVYRFKTEISENAFFRDTYFFSDNLFVQFVIDLGIPGTFFIVTIIGCILWQMFVFLRMPLDNRTYLLGVALMASSLSSLIGAYGAEPVLYNPEGPYFWFFAGALFRMAKPNFDRKTVWLR